MQRWRFYQGLRTEWRWYCTDEAGTVLAQSDRGFAELRACMENAESAGFTGQAYQVHARQAGALAQTQDDFLTDGEHRSRTGAPDEEATQ